MIKKLAILLLIFNSINTYSQESVLLKTRFQPNKEYDTQIITTSYSEVDFIADSLILDKITAKGIVLPMIMDTKSSINTKTFTDNFDKNGRLPATIEYGKMISEKTINGEKTEEEKPYSGMKILGQYGIDNKFSVDTIIGNKITKEMREILVSTFKSIQQDVNFPKQPIKIGENFTNEIPLTIPMAGMNPIYVKIHIEYLLKEIKDNKAIFDLKQTVNLDMSQEQVNLVATGSGSGISEYDISENYITKLYSVLPMNLTIVINEKITAKIKSETTTDMMITIE